MKIVSIIVYVSLRIYRKSTKISHNITWKNKIKKLIRTKGAKKLARAQMAQIKTYFSQQGIKDVSTDWHRFYADCNTVFSEKYMPENLFYIEIEPRLNRSVYFPSLTDKNILNRIFTNIRQPETVIKNINGCYYAASGSVGLKEAITLCDTGETLVLKPSLESGGGKNVMLFISNEGVTNSGHNLNDVLVGYGNDFIVQKVVPQHEVLKSLNPTSLNTIRIMTYLTGNGVEVLSTIVRIGRKGSSTDNATTGGISCGIQKSGQLNPIGYQLSGTPFTATDTGVEFKQVKLDFIQKIFDAADKLHREVPFFKLVSWDLAVDDEERIVLIEYNVMGQGINSHQLNNGPVLAPLLEVLKEHKN